MSLGSIVNTVANVSSRKSDKGKQSESSLYEFLGQISNRGIQIKSNFEVEFLQFSGFQFFCQSVNIPGLKTQNASLYYKCREVQVPIICEQEHEFQWTVINDGNGSIYTEIRHMLVYDYGYRMLNNGYKVKVKARGDQQNQAGLNIIMQGVRLTNISGLDFSHTDNSLQTFTVNGYVDFIDFENGKIKKKDGLLGKIDKLSNKISNVLGK